MDLKKTLSLCVALLLVVGFYGASQAADPQGVRIRVTHPAAGMWAGIGDSVVVDVEALPGVSPLSAVEVAISADTTNAKYGDVNGDGTADAQFTASKTTKTGTTTDGFDQYHFNLTVSAGYPESADANAVIQVKVTVTGQTVQKRLTNQLTDEVITSSPSFGLVGLGRKFGVDGRRPAAVISAVKVDTVGMGVATLFPGSTTQRAFKIGSQVKIQLNVSGIPSGASGKVYLVEPDSISTAGFPGNSLITRSFPFNALITGQSRDSVTLTAGQFSGNNVRLAAVAFLEDRAGNLSHPTDPAATAPSGLTDALVYSHVYDVTSPTITPKIPNKRGDADSLRFTGDKTATIAQVKTGDGVLDAGVSFTLRPLTFSVNEGTDTMFAGVAGADSIHIPGRASGEASYDTYTAGSDSLGAGSGDKGGKEIDLKLIAVDSVGNVTELALDDVIHDVVAPAISELFPQKAQVPPDPDNSNAPTINEITKNPRVTLSEKLDSLAVRYIEVTPWAGSTPHNLLLKLSKASAILGQPDVAHQLEWTAAADTLHTTAKYTLQVFAKDLAQNVSITAPDTMTYKAGFLNPVADSIVVASSDSVLAGSDLLVTLTAIDTAKSRAAGAHRPAVTHKRGARFRIVADGQDLSTVTIKDGGKGGAVTDNGDGTAVLDAVWDLGVREIKVNSKKVIDNFTIVVEDTTADATTGTVAVNFNGTNDNLYVDATEFAAYAVSAYETDAAGTMTMTTAVGEGFQVKVTPTDTYGNESTKKSAELDTKIAVTSVLQQVYVTFSSNMADAMVPAGPQPVVPGGSMFSLIAPDRKGDGMVISVKTANVQGDTSGVTSKQLTAAGASAPLSFVPHGEEPVIVTGAPKAPASLMVKDYKPDHGGFVMVTFPMSEDHKTVDVYRLYRELMVTTGMKDGVLVDDMDPMPKWVPWTTIDAVPVMEGGEMVARAVVPTVDNAKTRWAVTAERGGMTSMQEVAAKRVFTKESVQQMVQLLGADPNRVVTPEELSQLFAPSADYVKSLLGDRKNVVFAALDPDLSALLGKASVPQNIRTDSHGAKVSGMTISEAVASVDNIPPAEVTEAVGVANPSEMTVSLTWKPSVDDKIVAYSSYRGFMIPIPGVDHYEVHRIEGEEAVQVGGMLPAGSDGIVVELPAGASTVTYRIDALDLDNVTSALVSVEVGVPGAPTMFRDADEAPVYLVALSPRSPYVEDFEDFIAFAKAFETKEGDANYNPRADATGDGEIGFLDFVEFAKAFNRTAVEQSADGVTWEPIPVSKPVVVPVKPGVNENAELSLKLGSDRVLAGQTISVDVSLANLEALQGFGFELVYDSDKFEFVESAAAEDDLLKSAGGETPLFFEYTEPGRVTVANAIVKGGSVSGGGAVATLTFKVLREFEDDARFEVASGIVVDPSELTNPVVVLGALDIQSTPTEFALLQNYPNPFNPETTIKYNLAEGADVHLRIYNIVGQVVRTLVAERQSAGRYQVRWEGTDDRGMTVSSGIYFYQISTGKFQDVKRLMLLK